MDTTQFLQQLIATARANLAASATQRAGGGTATPREAARAALQEAHSALSQTTFFAAMDALGGQAAVLARLERELFGYDQPTTEEQ